MAKMKKTRYTQFFNKFSLIKYLSPIVHTGLDFAGTYADEG